MNAYAEAKTDVVLAVLERARAWRASTSVRLSTSSRDSGMLGA